MSDGEINVDSIDGEVLTSANIVGELYPQGEKGDKGDPGNDGFSPTVTTEKVGKTTTIKITDAEGEHTATILDGADGQGSGDMRTEVYDINHNGIVDDAEKVNGHTVAKDVPADAEFTDTTYTAGTGIDITNGVITNTQTSAEWGNITGTLSDQTDLQNALDDKADASDIPTKVSDLTNDSGFIDKDVNNLTNYDTSTAVDTKISNSEEVLVGSDSGIKASHELWVDTNDVTSYVNSEISNEYGTAQNIGYSQEYFNTVRNSIDSNISTINDKLDGDKPMGDIVASSYSTKNLINPYTIISGSVNATTGEYSYYNYSVVSDYIPVKANKQYIIKLNNVNDNQFIFRVCLYSTSKVYSSTLVNNVTVTQQTFSVDMNGYVRICFGKDGYSSIVGSDIINANPQLEEGTTATAYKRYFDTQEETLKPHILFEGSSTDPQLNDRIDAYTYIEIYGYESGNRKVFTKIHKSGTFENKQCVVSASFVANNIMYTRGTVFNLYERSLQTNNSYEVQITASGTTIVTSTKVITIAKVVGYR